jgi:hypothetical protein
MQYGMQDKTRTVLIHHHQPCTVVDATTAIPISRSRVLQAAGIQRNS